MHVKADKLFYLIEREDKSWWNKKKYLQVKRKGAVASATSYVTGKCQRWFLTSNIINVKTLQIYLHLAALREGATTKYFTLQRHKNTSLLHWHPFNYMVKSWVLKVLIGNVNISTWLTVNYQKWRWCFTTCCPKTRFLHEDLNSFEEFIMEVPTSLDSLINH
jgi:hypothetical protein